MDHKMSYKLPSRASLGKSVQSTLDHAIQNYRDPTEEFIAGGRRTVMGFILPPWQRGLVWSEYQSISFIESLWKGIPVGTYSYNALYGSGNLDGILIDGQQRLWAVQQYLDGVFKVFGGTYDELSKTDKRRFGFGTSFPCFITETDDEDYLKSYYNLMNFGGTDHSGESPAT